LILAKIKAPNRLDKALEAVTEIDENNNINKAPNQIHITQPDTTPRHLQQYPHQHIQMRTIVANNDPSFTWTTPSDPSGIAGYSYTLDHSSSTTPDTSVDTTGNSKSYTNLADGIWYYPRQSKGQCGKLGQR